MANPICPRCSGPVRHDKFEDMYSCRSCYFFFYPGEVGAKEDPEAGIWKEPLIRQNPDG